MTTSTHKAKPARTPADDVLAAPLPENVSAAVKLVPTAQNSREEKGNHLNPRMGRLLRAFRAVNGNIAQTKVAGNPATGASFVQDGNKIPLYTTHCQIATLEQGGCKKGADEATVKLLAVALGVTEDVIRALNEADLKERAASGDKRAMKVLGIEDEKPAEESKPSKVEAIVDAATKGEVSLVKK